MDEEKPLLDHAVELLTRLRRGGSSLHGSARLTVPNTHA